MREPPLALLALLAFGTPAPGGAQTAEALRSGGLAQFSTAQGFALKPFAAQRRVVVSGPVKLQGTGLLPDENGVTVIVTFNGATRVSGDGGRVAGGRSFSFTQTLTHYGQPYFSQTRRLSMSLEVTCDGKPAGSVAVAGDVLIQGPKTGDMFVLNGSGTLSGEAFLDCGEAPQPRR